MRPTPQTGTSEPQEPPDTPVFPQDPVSITEAVKKFYTGRTPSPYYGDLPRTSSVTQVENRVQTDNMVGHDSHAPSPPREPQPTTPTGSGTLGLETIREDDEVCDNSRLGPDAVDMTPVDPLEGYPTGQEVFLVQGCSDQALVCDHNTHECFFLK